VAGIEEGSGPVTVFREAQRHSIEISGQLEDRDLGGMLNEVTERISRMDLDADYDVKPVGTAMLMQEGFASLKTAFLLSLLLIYMVLAAQFESLRSPLVVIFTAPLAAIGVVAAMLLARTTFGITAYIGIIILGGIVVNNGIILVDFIEKLRREGTPVAEATLKSISYRIRPVLMTAFTTILGLLPLAVQLGDGTELQAPLAQVLIGGMFTATFLTLIVIPVLYSIVHRQGDG
jgi:HAE1 family hydrophobic/amphiphilic exporter-1